MEQEQFKLDYYSGKQALENGRYSLSVKYLERSSQQVAFNTYFGGEVRIWLVTAYQANQKIDQAIALCRELVNHPHPDIRSKSKSLLYIIEAPRLKRPKKWMSEIPDLADLPESEPEFQHNRGSVKPKTKPTETVDPASINSQDNQFITLSLILLLVFLGSLIWFNR